MPQNLGLYFEVMEARADYEKKASLWQDHYQVCCRCRMAAWSRDPFLNACDVGREWYRAFKRGLKIRDRIVKRWEASKALLAQWETKDALEGRR